MYPSPVSLYALRLSITQGATSSMLRRNMAERSTATSAVFLATVGLSMSIFSLKQMLSSTERQYDMRRFH